MAPASRLAPRLGSRAPAAALVGLLAALPGCAAPTGARGGPPSWGPVTVGTVGARAAAPRVAPGGEVPPGGARSTPEPGERCEGADPDPVPIFAGGARTGAVCPDAAARAGLTILDLRDDWRPLVLGDDPAAGEAGKQPYAATYLALAAGRFGAGPAWEDAREDRYLELYGISPTFTLLRERLLQQQRHRCHELLAAAVPAPGAPAATTPAARRAALVLVQQHLRCDGLLGKAHAPGRLDPRTRSAVELFQRRHMIIGSGLDEETRRAILASSANLDFLALLRALRERVVDATGLLEDGSARGEWGQVVGRHLDSAAFRTLPAGAAAGEGAPDLISPATDAAARALGWTSPQAAIVALSAAWKDGAAPGRIAVRLPPPPAYHSEAMELRAEIDRGDVWYDYPYGPRGRELPQPVTRRPTLTLYARSGPEGREVALVRWPTTIGGWQVDKLPGNRLRYRYKGSDVGPRVWHEVVASPAWLPPPSTPDKELVRRDGAGRWAPRDEVVGPGYRSAYGLVMIVHDGVQEPRAGAPVYEDLGIRTHGSANYRSIVRSNSHGCHRLYNHLAVRLTSFLLRHRAHVRHGNLRTDFARTLRWRGQRLELRIASRGYRYELTPPVPVEVLPGTIHGAATSPITRPMPLPMDKAREYAGQPAR